MYTIMILKTNKQTNKQTDKQTNKPFSAIRSIAPLYSLKTKIVF